MFDKIYEPQEESFMLREQVRKHARGKFLDMGTGSGILSQAAKENKKVTEILAVDLNGAAVRYVKKLGFNAIKSDLFKKVTAVFDTIVFNAPYLPEDMREKRDEHHMAVCGGKNGWEIVERFFDQVSPHLRTDGIILLLFSSLTDKKKVDEIIANKLFKSKLLVDKRYFFENVYIYEVKKSDLLIDMEAKQLHDIKYFAKGKRGIVYQADYLGEKVAVKVESPSSQAIAKIENEINTLKELNKYGIGPEIYFHNKNWFAMQFIEGQTILDFLESASRKHALQVLHKTLKMCYELDKLQINKQELSHPHKHIIIDKHLHPVFIDFERAKKTTNPQNVSQFVQFLTSKGLAVLLEKKRIHFDKQTLIDAVKEYKKDMSKEKFHTIFEKIA